MARFHPVRDTRWRSSAMLRMAWRAQCSWQTGWCSKTAPTRARTCSGWSRSASHSRRRFRRSARCWLPEARGPGSNHERRRRYSRLDLASEPGNRDGWNGLRADTAHGRTLERPEHFPGEVRRRMQRRGGTQLPIALGGLSQQGQRAPLPSGDRRGSGEHAVSGPVRRGPRRLRDQDYAVLRGRFLRSDPRHTEEDRRPGQSPDAADRGPRQALESVDPGALRPNVLQSGVEGRSRLHSQGALDLAQEGGRKNPRHQCAGGGDQSGRQPFGRGVGDLDREIEARPPQLKLGCSKLSENSRSGSNHCSSSSRFAPRTSASISSTEYLYELSVWILSPRAKANSRFKAATRMTCDWVLSRYMSTF